MSNREFKIKLINALKERNIFTEQTSDIQIRTRCPYCGDSRKNLRTGHLYIRINPNDNLPILYNCFKCPAQGILKYEDLELLDINEPSFKSGMGVLNKTSDKMTHMSTEVPYKYFEYKIPENFVKYKIEYLENRLGVEFTDEELINMRVITSLKDFLSLNNINTITCRPNMAKMVERNYVGFMSNNGAYILFRDITDKSDIRWYKYPITDESKGQMSFYSIKSTIDLYSKDMITINLSEGIFDCLSISHNLKYNTDNILNIAVCGKFYTKIIRYLFGMGLVGSNIILNIFADRDGTEDTSIEYYRKILKKYSYLVGELIVYYNLLAKVCGVMKEKILLQKNKI